MASVLDILVYEHMRACVCKIFYYICYAIRSTMCIYYGCVCVNIYIYIYIYKRYNYINTCMCMCVSCMALHYTLFGLWHADLRQLILRLRLLNAVSLHTVRNIL